MTPTLEQFIIGMLFLIMGAYTHEFGHYLFARFFGGNPKISKWYFSLVPAQVSLEMSDMKQWQVRITSGFMFVFIPIAMAALWHQILWLAAFSIGTLAISPRDYIGLIHPEVLIKMGKEEPVTQNDFDHPDVL